jgi:hypothetical protein
MVNSEDFTFKCGHPSRLAQYQISFIKVRIFCASTLAGMTGGNLGLAQPSRSVAAANLKKTLAALRE